MSKVLSVILVLALLVCIGVAAYFGINLSKAEKENENMSQTVSSLQQQVNAIGPMGTMYTVKIDVSVGDEITADNIVPVSIPQYCITDNYVNSIEQITGCFYKVDLQQGTPLTMDMVMTEEFDSPSYIRELTLDYGPVDCVVGDYIDLRLDLPFGESFIVLPHKRIMGKVDKTIQIHMDEAELALYKSALIDKAYYGDVGLNLYAVKYVEPGVYDDTVMPFYPVRVEIAGVVAVNPNIANKAQCINTKLRTDIDLRLSQVNSTVGGKLSSGVSKEASNIDSARDFFADNANNPNPAVEADTYDGSIGAADGYDSSGNTSKVTSSMMSQTEGENQFSDIDLIE